MNAIVAFALAQVSADPETIRDTADDVLSRRPYLDAARPPSLQERIFNWISNEIGDLLNALSSVGGRGTGWIIIGLFSVLILWMLSRLVRSWTRLPSAESLPDPEIEIIAGRSPEEWMSEAQAAEAEQRWAEAIRFRHRALVTKLIDHELIDSAPGQTAGTIARVVTEQVPPAAPAMVDLTAVFKRVWYGPSAATAGDLDAFRRSTDHVESAVAAAADAAKSSRAGRSNSAADSLSVAP